MKSFYSPALYADSASGVDSGVPEQPGSDVARSEFRSFGVNTCTRARIAVYEAPAAAPRVFDVESAPVGLFIEQLAAKVHELSRAEGGSIPYTVVREVAENLIHADFAEPVVSILDAGSTIRFADQGPGIFDKDRALLPGFTTASGEMKDYIRGVGSGLPIVREYLIHSGGSLAIEDNLGTGSVVTVYAGPRVQTASTPVQNPRADVPSTHMFGSDSGTAAQSSFEVEEESGPTQTVVRTAVPRLTARQKHVLALVMESGLAGPSLVSKELGVGISTAYRDLAYLEELGLIVADGGKRTLTEAGLEYLGNLTNRS